MIRTNRCFAASKPSADCSPRAIRRTADLIALKLDAASDHAPHDRTDVHVGDLVALGATPEEIDEAAQWVRAVNVDPERDAKIDWVKHHVAESSHR